MEKEKILAELEEIRKIMRYSEKIVKEQRDLAAEMVKELDYELNNMSDNRGRLMMLMEQINGS